MTQITENYVSPDRLDAAVSGLRAEMEKRFSGIERRFSDMEKRFSDQTRWIVGWMTGLVASAAAIIIAVLQ